MDKSWINKSRTSDDYLQGLDQFLKFAFDNASKENMILCPCKNCTNCFWKKFEIVYEHLLCDGFMQGYTRWVFHGEGTTSSEPIHNSNSQDEQNHYDEMDELIHDAFFNPTSDFEAEDLGIEDPRDKLDFETRKFYRLVKDANQELYPGCKEFSKLSFIVRLLQIKCLGGWSNKSFDMLLQLLKQALPEGETLPRSFYETDKIIRDLGLGYDKIDACPNDCILYRNEFANASSCHVCGTSRWKVDESKTSNRKSKDDCSRKVSAKVLRYFPLKPRLQRLFMSSKTASDMRWHNEGRTKDGVLRHPADSTAWKDFDHRHQDFSSDPCNVRLGLASDGFNPFRTMSIAHSTWPVILIPYNLPPWMCMKQPYFILSLLIPGPSAPGNNIDIYMQPLIDELKELWVEGVKTYDVSCGETFQMRAAILWTISDFPGYAYLSGWSTKGRLACPYCNKDTCSYYLKHGRKFCYMGHRRFLDSTHSFRRDASSFDGTREYREAPVLLSGCEILEQVKDVNTILGKHNHNTRGKKRGQEDEAQLSLNWKKRSIFFELPYWETLLVRHNLDVMHIEKNLCDNVLYTLINEEGKSKDNMKACLDLQEMGIRHDLHPIAKGSKTYLPPACFTMSKNEKEDFCKVLKGVKFPDGYASNLSNRVRVKERKILGLKSHDSHVLMQHLLPLAVRKILPKNVSTILIELSNFFRELCHKTLRVKDIQQIENQIALILCHLERIFPPAFFDIMVHLPIHLATEAKIAGPVQYRWMYPIERFLSRLKSYVRNRSRPEGSIAEGYLIEESLTFCSRYLHGAETRFNRPIRNDELNATPSRERSFFSHIGRSLDDGEVVTLDYTTWTQAHRYVLFNYEPISPYLKKHLQEIKTQSRRARRHEIERIHNDTFHEWFKSYVQQLMEGNNEILEEIKWLASGPLMTVRRYKGYIVNGFRFHTKEVEEKRRTQNSGVVVVANTSSFSSSKDQNPIQGDVTYYGVIREIIELYYNEKAKIVLFKCDWVDVRAEGRGIKKDEFGFTLVNFRRLLYSNENISNEPFVLASQAEQVFYIQDPIEEDWHVVLGTKPRNFFDMSTKKGGDDLEIYYPSDLEINLNEERSTSNDIDNGNWARTDIPGSTLNIPLDITHVRDAIQGDGSESDEAVDIDFRCHY